MNARVGANSSYTSLNKLFAADAADRKVSIQRIDDFLPGALANTNCSPSFTWVLLEEVDISMDDASFFLTHNPASTPAWGNERPATYHSRSGSLSFADGHVEIWIYSAFPPQPTDKLMMFERY